MCGIVGYIGTEGSALGAVLDGLTTLEYRGYDSAGVAYLAGTHLHTKKRVGRVKTLRDSLTSARPSTLAIGHTRWATHGKPTEVNAHPHTNTTGTIAVVHNGIIENYTELRAHLSTHGYSFTSDTDTEVIPQLIDFYRKTSESFQDAFTAALQQLRGTFALAVVTTEDPDALYAARVGSPLVLGIGDKFLMLASDAGAMTAQTKQVVYLQDFELLRLERKGTFSLMDFRNNTRITRASELLDYDPLTAEKGNYAHFMLKEIHEAPATIRAALTGRLAAHSHSVKLGGLEAFQTQLQYIDRLVIVACGTSYYAGLLGEYLIEEIAGIPVEVQLASEFKYRNEPFSRGTAVLAISQSGETADTIAALKKVEEYGVLRLGIVNAVGSTIARMTDAGVYCHAGPEQAVASTKAFMAQVTILSLLAAYLCRTPSALSDSLLEELALLPVKIESLLEDTADYQRLAKKYAGYRNFLYIGRKYSYPCALEGALKLKEVSYIHAEGYAAGEMKHGPLAMIDADFPTFAVIPEGPLREKTYGNIEEIRARNGKVIAVATKGDTRIKELTDDVIFIPSTLEQTSPLLAAVALQLFSYYVAVEKGYDVDRPRNLAKSVTVE